MPFSTHLNKTMECYVKCLVAGPVKTQKGIWVQKSKVVSLEVLLIICLPDKHIHSSPLYFNSFAFLLSQISDPVSVNIDMVI